MRKPRISKNAFFFTLGALASYATHDHVVRLHEYVPPKPQVEVGEHPHPYALRLEREKNRQGTEVFLYDPITDEKVQVFDHLYTGNLEHRYHALRAAGGNLKTVLDYEPFWEGAQDNAEGIVNKLRCYWMGLKEKVSNNDQEGS